jgi:hypothetical protein
MADGDMDSNLWGFWTSPGSGAGEIGIVVGILLLVVLAIFIWAAFWRKPPRRRKHSYRHVSDPEGGLPRREKHKSGLLAGLGRRRRHRRHSRERPANPTLAQVGGLPPPRREPPPGP